jgi:cytochrome c-type protein NapB
MIPDPERRLLSVAGAAVLTVAVAGFISGTRAPERTQVPEVESKTNGFSLARGYGDLRAGRRGPNANMYEQAFAWLRSAGPSLTDPVEQTEEERLSALEARRARRAYAGAPPVVPHSIQEREAAACLTCHGTGSRLAGLRAPMMSHQEYTMCVQCHAPQRQESSRVRAMAPVGEDNLFVGVSEPGPGEIAWEGAPPLVPHATFMRESCNSCHGPHGAQGLKTPHPVRASCSQCHATSADFDQNSPPTLPPKLGPP